MNDHLPAPFGKLKAQLKLADLIFEVRDARAPASSGHPQAAKLFASRPRLIVLSHMDLADSQRVKHWIKSKHVDHDTEVVALSLKQSGNKRRLLSVASRLTESGDKRRFSQGILPRAARACVVGLPNVGKSTFINWLIGRHKAPAGNKPGITRSCQWIRIGSQFELLDTPGILPPTSFDPEIAVRLAAINLLPERHYQPEEIALWAIDYLSKTYPNRLRDYGLDLRSAEFMLEQIAQLKNLRGRNNSPDLLRAATMFLSDLRSGRLGPIFFDATAE